MTRISSIPCTLLVITEAIAPMVTELAVRAASRREVRAMPTPFTHHHLPLDLGVPSSKVKVP
ncbi:MAG: hypothetical protein ACYTX0_58710, partial [Nostoc sp.]